jgi:hypothetical protein
MGGGAGAAGDEDELGDPDGEGGDDCPSPGLAGPPDELQATSRKPRRIEQTRMNRPYAVAPQGIAAFLHHRTICGRSIGGGPRRLLDGGRK